ncbi:MULTISPECIES: hypothetical protein [Pseudomonas]|uniref:Uncharacterized protein n=1 Tax=Pseudomonas sessilinigenes TaxID=658629 RepID=A0ABX8MIM4_9PSED|nr:MULTISPECIES: hypothetical protein [Pseudomonas]AZC26888.1 hypothetical protein C4K39_5243 [Pseudomonas sessilinigenes]QXH39142.1 hypothetical protein KSS89_23320 [Pseudomonas sessilinigenes]UMZ09311.1 hypothetical protein I9018_17305 [Pseudomonas sp. MPFS]
MKFTLAGQVIDPKSVGYRSLGFGEALAIAATPYELRISHSELPPDFLDHADSFTAQCQSDDLAQGFIDIPELEAIDYPGFRTLLTSHPDLAARLIRDYLYFDLFYSLFPNSVGLDVVINDITDLYLQEDSIIVTGKTFAAR